MRSQYFHRKAFAPILIALTLVLALSALIRPSSAAGSATMYMQQVNPMVVGATLTVQVRVNTGGARVNAVQADFTYPTGALSFVSIEDISQSSFNISAQATGGSGSVAIGRGSTAAGGLLGDLKVANVNFTVLAAGTATLTFQNSSVLLDSTSSTDVLGTKTNGQFTNSAGLATNQILNSGSVLNSDNGQYRAVMQGDGNFVIYNLANVPIWHASTSGHPGARVVMQGDGNLVVYSSGNAALWNASTSGYSGSVAIMQNDGNLVIYNASGRAVWSTYTGALYQRLNAGQVLNPGDFIRSGNGLFRAVMQHDGNFVVYNSGNAALWNSGTGGNSGARVAMQGDGNLVVYSSINAALWNSGTGGNTNANVVIQSDGNLVIYAPSGRALWSRATGRL